MSDTFDNIKQREKGLRRELTSRQLTMIALGGAIGGTGPPPHSEEQEMGRCVRARRLPTRCRDKTEQQVARLIEK